MALTATCIHEVRSTGSDTACSGVFDPSQTAGMLTDGAATSATGNSPVFSSASYNFVAGDVGAWVYVSSGTNWTPGWYEIASVASNVATLKAAVGEAVKDPHLVANTTAGCATVASPTGATWTIDYSQQAAARFTYTDITYVSGTTFTSAGNPFGKQQVGNIVRIDSGTNFTAGLYIITSVTGTTATFNATACSGASSNGAGCLGGAYATPGYADGKSETGNMIFVKEAIYTTTSASAGVAGGRCATAKGYEMIGYTTIRGDDGRFTLKCGAGVGGILFGGYAEPKRIRNAIADGNSVVSTEGFNINGSYGRVRNCVAKNIYYDGFTATHCVDCYATACRYGFSGCLSHLRCDASACTSGGFTGTTMHCVDCIARGTTGIGFASDYYAVWEGCVAYSSSSHGFSSNGYTAVANNCIAVSNGGYGIRASSLGRRQFSNNCAFYNNTSGQTNLMGNHAPITLSGDPFTNAAGGDFTVDNTSGEGALLRGLAIPATWPNAVTVSYRDIGAVQHQDSGGGSTNVGNRIGPGALIRN